MEEYAVDDEELRDKFRELKISLKPDQKISNTVWENEKVKRECRSLQSEINRLRKILISPNLNYDKFDDKNLGFKIQNHFDEESEVLKQQVVLKQVAHNQVKIEIQNQEKSQKTVEKAKNFGQTMSSSQLKTTQKEDNNERFDDIEGVNTLGLPAFKKQNKKQLVEHIHQLEDAVSSYKQSLADLVKDHKVLNDSYMDELNKNGKIENSINVLKRIINKLIGRDSAIEEDDEP